MKIVELCLSPGVGGLELYAANCARRLRELGHDCLSVVRGETLLAGRLADAGLPVHAFGKAGKVLPLLAAQRLARLLEAESADVLHAHWGPDLALAALARRWCRRPVALAFTRQMLLTRDKRDPYHRYVYGAVDLFIAITREVRGQALRHLPVPEDRIRLLCYGVPAGRAMTEDGRAKLRTELGIPADAQLAVALVGRMEREKGQHVLVDAIGRLRAAGVRVHATLIGPAMDEDWVARLKGEVEARGLGGAVRFMGPHRQPQALLPAFDALVLATYRETFGLVLPEAMRTGIAVLGTDAGGVPEIIEDGRTGLLFPPGDAAALAERLGRLAADPAFRRGLAAAGKARADRDFSEERHYAELAGMFEESVARRRRESGER